MLAVELAAIGEVEGDPRDGHGSGRSAHEVMPVMLGPMTVKSVARATERFFTSRGGS